MASQEEIEKVIEKTNIVELVSKYVKLEKQGKNYRGLCPFHNEDTPSFFVSPEKNIAKCFGCGKGGNPINFLMEVENISFGEALGRLADECGVKITNNVRNKTSENFTKYYKIMQIAIDFYKKNLEVSKEGQEALAYLHKRGLDDETIKMFNIGLAPKPGNSLYKVLQELGCLELDMIETGLIDRGRDGYYDLFASRIMFPIYDAANNPIAFSGRIYLPSQKGQPKYINSRETIIYKKGFNFFNIQQARSEILRKKRVVLHEGQMDVVASVRSGLKEAICSLGTALTNNQVNVLSRFTNDVIICYDGDAAGRRASLKAIKLFKNANFNVRLVLLPNGMDPDEFVNKYGSNEFLNYFESNIVDCNQYIFNQAFIDKNLNDGFVVGEIKKEIFDMVSHTSSTECEHYLRELAKKLNCSYDAVASDYSNYYTSGDNTQYVDNYPYDQLKQSNINDVDDYYPEIIKDDDLKATCEQRLFMYAKQSKDKALYIDSILNDRMSALSYENQGLWISLINDYYQNYEVFQEGKFIKMLSKENFLTYTNMLEILKKDKNPYTDCDLMECLEKLLQVKLDKENYEINKKILNLDDVDKETKLIADKFKNKKRKELLKSRRNKNGI